LTVASTSVAAETSLPFHCLAMTTSSRSTIPDFSHHVTLWMTEILLTHWPESWWT
jgi:hypothetical protein